MGNIIMYDRHHGRINGDTSGEINGAYIITGFTTETIGEIAYEMVDCDYEFPVGTLYDSKNHPLVKDVMQNDIDTARLILDI